MSEKGQTGGKPAGDMKMLRNQREARPKLSINQYNGTVYGVRGTEYGADKYARGNYHGSPPAGVDPVERFAEYIDAAMRHLGKIAQAINVAKGTGGDVRAACAVVDDEASGGFPPSMLPHIAHAIAGLKIAVECGTNDGLLPLDPGQPWIKHEMYQDVLERRAAGKKGNSLEGLRDDQIRAQQGLPQKDNPDSERERIARLEKLKAGVLPADVRAKRWPGESDAQLAKRFEAEALPEPDFSSGRPVAELDREISDGFNSPTFPSGVRM